MTSIEAIINRQLLKWEFESKVEGEPEKAHPHPNPIVTISRQSGSRGSYFGSRLAQRLGFQRLHREAIELVSRSTGYQKRILESLDGHFRDRLELMVESILTGSAIDYTDYTRQLCRMVLSMSQLGGVILMGRGGNHILGPKRGFHIRVVCPKEKRIENLVKYKEITEDEAVEVIEKSDTDRKRFVKQVFSADIDDPHHYDLVVNTSYMDIEDLVETTVIAYRAKMNKLTYLDHDKV